LNKGKLNLFIENLNLSIRGIRSKDRMLPSFIIIGVQKAGTTTLYDYLIKHPLILPALKKETKYFDLFHNKSLNWYKAFFPIKSKKFITGEATPDYFFYKEIPGRINKILPNVKLIVLLRNPVERAISQYNFNIDRKIENLSFEAAIKEEDKRISANFKIKLKSGYMSNSYREYSYINRSRYAEQLKHWLKYFSIDQFLFCTTEQMKNDSLNTVNSVYEFLELEKVNQVKAIQKNVSKNKLRLSDPLLSNLRESFKSENEALYSIIGKRFNW